MKKQRCHMCKKQWSGAGSFCIPCKAAQSHFAKEAEKQAAKGKRWFTRRDPIGTESNINEKDRSY